MRFNAAVAEVRQTYQELALAAGLVSDARDGDAGSEALIEYLEAFRAGVGLCGSLAALGLDSADLERLADEAARQWTATFNPRPIVEADFVELYRAVLHDRDAVAA